MGLEKVNWRKEYWIDNLFNIIIGIMCIVIICLDVSKYIVIGPILVSLFINVSAKGFFNKNKFK